MRRLRTIALLLAVGGGGIFWLMTRPLPAIGPEAFAALDAQGDASRGRTVFFAGGCAACHKTPGQDDPL